MIEDSKIEFSGVVVCYNEGRMLRQCFESLSFCRELIVVDLGSTDDSLSIAEDCGARIIHHEHAPHPNIPRQYGISKARNEWVITADPDEVFPKHEIEKVRAVISEHEDLAAIRLPIQYYFKGKALNCTIYGKPGRTRWAFVHRDRIQGTPYIHREFLPNQKIYHFSSSDIEPIKHYWVNSYGELFTKQLRYIRSEGEAKYAKGARFSWRSGFKHMGSSLKINLIDFRGLTGGLDGIFLSFNRAWYEFMSWLSLRKYERDLQMADGKNAEEGRPATN